MNKIVKTAAGYVGQKEIEAGQNQGFESADFEKRMKTAGWYKGGAWCGHFAILVYTESGAENTFYYSHKEKKVVSYLTGSTVESMRRAEEAENWHIYPVIGAVAIWRNFKNGKAQGTGHMGIVSAFEFSCSGRRTGLQPPTGWVETIDGNTTQAGSREGNAVVTKMRAFDWTRNNGLRLMGFIHPRKK